MKNALPMMRYFSSNLLFFLIISLIFFSYATKRYAEENYISWVAVSIPAPPINLVETEIG